LIAPAGTGVLAALSGKALMVQPISGYGLTVLLDHGNGWQTLYAHLLSARIRPGQLTQTGDLIGNVGKSGQASTAHLHFELRRFKNGQMMAIDPAPLLNQSSRRWTKGNSWWLSKASKRWEQEIKRKPSYK
jgi:murein DD-endopeptidase MepM/ murein hydrolase activator NlpD